MRGADDRPRSSETGPWFADDDPVACLVALQAVREGAVAEEDAFHRLRGEVLAAVGDASLITRLQELAVSAPVAADRVDAAHLLDDALDLPPITGGPDATAELAGRVLSSSGADGVRARLAAAAATTDGRRWRAARFADGHAGDVVAALAATQDVDRDVAADPARLLATLDARGGAYDAAHLLLCAALGEGRIAGPRMRPSPCDVVDPWRLECDLGPPRRGLRVALLRFRDGAWRVIDGFSADLSLLEPHEFRRRWRVHRLYESVASWRVPGTSSPRTPLPADVEELALCLVRTSVGLCWEVRRHSRGGPGRGGSPLVGAELVPVLGAAALGGGPWSHAVTWFPDCVTVLWTEEPGWLPADGASAWRAALDAAASRIAGVARHPGGDELASLMLDDLLPLATVVPLPGARDVLVERARALEDDAERALARLAVCRVDPDALSADEVRAAFARPTPLALAAHAYLATDSKVVRSVVADRLQLAPYAWRDPRLFATRVCEGRIGAAGVDDVPLFASLPPIASVGTSAVALVLLIALTSVARRGRSPATQGIGAFGALVVGLAYVAVDLRVGPLDLFPDACGLGAAGLAALMGVAGARRVARAFWAGGIAAAVADVSHYLDLGAAGWDAAAGVCTIIGVTELVVVTARLPRGTEARAPRATGGGALVRVVTALLLAVIVRRPVVLAVTGALNGNVLEGEVRALVAGIPFVAPLCAAVAILVRRSALQNGRPLRPLPVLFALAWLLPGAFLLLAPASDVLSAWAASAPIEDAPTVRALLGIAMMAALVWALVGLRMAQSGVRETGHG